jgi:hypothetical protein
MPMARGMQSTMCVCGASVALSPPAARFRGSDARERADWPCSYVKLAAGTSVDDLRATLEAKYATEPFVRVLPAGQVGTEKTNLTPSPPLRSTVRLHQLGQVTFR